MTAPKRRACRHVNTLRYNNGNDHELCLDCKAEREIEIVWKPMTRWTRRLPTKKGGTDAK